MQEIAVPKPEVRATPDADYARGVALVALAGGFFSLGGLLIRLIEAASSWQIVMYRSLALVLTLVLIIAVRHRGRLSEAFRRTGRNGVAAGAALAGGFIGFILALHYTSVGNAVFMLGGAPFFAALLAWLVLGEVVRRTTVVAMVVAMAGILIMVGGGLVLGTLRGNLLALGASFCFALFTVFLRRGRAQDMMPCVAIAGALGALAALPVVLVQAPTIEAALLLSGRDFALCATMGVVQVGCGLTLFTLGARHVPAVELTLLSMTELVLAPIWVWLGVGEVPSGYTLIGGAVILAAIAYRALADARRQAPRGEAPLRST